MSNAAFGGPTMSNAASRGFISDDSNLVGQESKIPFLTKAVGPTGEKLKVFQFPTDHSMGLLIDQGKVRDTGLQARGQVIIPANKRLRLQVSPFLTIHPSYFRRFGPDDVAEIAMINNEGVTNETLNYMDHLAGLIDLTVFETNVNDDCIPTLDALTGLDTLNVSNTNITGCLLYTSRCV